MEAAPQTKDEIVIASLKGVSPEAFRKELAEVVGGEWKAEGNLFRLIRTSEMSRAQEAEEHALRVAEVTEGVEELQRKVAERPAFDSAAATSLAKKVAALYAKHKGHLSDGNGLRESIALEPESPAGRLAIAAVATLGVKQLAEVEPGGRIVYATTPTRMQRRLPRDLSGVVRRYVEEQTAYVAALRRVPAAEEWANSWSPLLRKETPMAPSGILIATSRSPYNDALGVDVKLLDAEGKYIGEHRTLLQLTKRERSPALAEGKVALSDLSHRFVEAFKAMQSGTTFLKDEVLRRAMERPEERDPLSYVATDGLLALSKEKNVLACIPDSGFLEPAFTSVDTDGKLDLGRFSQWLGDQCVVSQKDGWFVARPKQRVRSRNLRVDRRVAGEFFRGAVRSGGASLEDMAALATQVPRRYTDTLMPILAFFILPDLNASITDRNIELLRVYGRLTPNQRIALHNGDPIRAHQLTAASIADLNYMIYRADSPVSIMFSGPPPPDGVFQNSLTREVTYALPNGIPSDAVLSVMSNDADAVIPDGGGSGGADYQPMSAWALAFHQVRAENADPSDRREKAAYNRFRYGYTRSHNLKVELADSISLRTDIKENHFPRNTVSVAYEALPESFRRAVEDAKIQVRRDHFPKGKVPPPAR
jgi:hypothetical protein